MDSSQSCFNRRAPAILGFYCVQEIESLGFCGGYLILNQHARPLEFHCTLPILPERAQQILYGPSLRPYLIAEHIGPPLVAKSTQRPEVILVNDLDGIELSQHVELPVVLVQSDGKGGFRLEAGKAENLADDNCPARCSQTGLDLLEPFERIREAIEEAHSVAR
ncbi:MAG: hypothetical protein ACR2NP_08805 [Pirellulaceae bacterium]